jgi:hypothetical protein
MAPAFASCDEMCNHNYMNMGQRNSNADSQAEQVRGWLMGRLPEGWFAGPPEVLVDREEITVIGSLPPVDAGPAAASPAGPRGRAESGDAEDVSDPEASKADVSAMALGRSRRFREETREARIAIACEAEALFDRKVSWGVVCDGQGVMFTTLSVPVMTRLRQSERQVLDTLVDAGVARSRSDALAWCARLVGQHEDSWLADLRTALRHVAEVRAQGPRS